MYAKPFKALAAALSIFLVSSTALANEGTQTQLTPKLPDVWKVVDGKWAFVSQKPKAKHQVFFKPTVLQAVDSQVQVKLEKMPFITVELLASED